MNRDWPPTGASIVLDAELLDGAGTLVNLSTRVLAVTGSGLTLLPPIFEHPVMADLSYSHLVMRWHDPDAGPSTITADLGPVNRLDRFAPWQVTITGPVERHQRRRYIREQVPGHASLTQPESGLIPAPRGGVSALPLRGEMADLSEGGVRVVTRQPPCLDFGRTTEVRLEPVEGPSPVVPDCSILRIEAGDGMWTVVATFPEQHPASDAVRTLVFTAMRYRVRAANAMAAAQAADA